MSLGDPNEQVWTGLQQSPPDVTKEGYQVWFPRLPYLTFPGGTLLYTLFHNTFDVTYFLPTPWTDISLWKLYLPSIYCLQAVIKWAASTRCVLGINRNRARAMTRILIHVTANDWLGKAWSSALWAFLE